MIGKRIAQVIFALVVGLACALSVLPARWLIAVLPAAWPVRIADASGTVWNGQALLAIGPNGQQRTLPDAIRWNWNWQWGSAPSMRVQHPWLTGPLDLAPSWTGVRVGAQRMRLPASTLVLAGAPFNTLEPEGQLVASWPAFQTGRAREGELLQIQWNDAGLGRVRVRPLGSYTATLSQNTTSARTLKVDTRNGVLRVEGEGKASGGRWQFKGTAQADAKADDITRDALAPLLAMLGRRSGDITTLQY